MVILLDLLDTKIKSLQQINTFAENKLHLTAALERHSFDTPEIVFALLEKG